MLAAAIVKEGSKAVAAGMNPMDLKRGIDLAVEDRGRGTEEELEEGDLEFSEIAQVGTISANGDKEIGQTTSPRRWKRSATRA